MLYIIKKDYFLADYILAPLEKQSDIRIIRHCRVKKYFLSAVLKFLSVNFRIGKVHKFFISKEIEELSRITEKDSVLFFGVENLKDILLISRYIGSCRKKSLWIWNPIFTINRNFFSRYFYVWTLKRNRLNIYTFDKGDADNYGLNYGRQVYIKSASSNSVCEQDLYFIGRDKKRIKSLMNFREYLEEQSITYKFCILPDKRTVYTEEEKQFLITAPLSYEMTLRQICASKSILDITQDSQCGITVRVLESIFLGKKLITNNLSVQKEDFYSPQRIFILGKDVPSTLKQFIDSPYPPVPFEILKNYEINTWIKQFF